MSCGLAAMLAETGWTVSAKCSFDFSMLLLFCFSFLRPSLAL